MESPSRASTGQVRDLHGDHFISKVFPLLEQVLFAMECRNSSPLQLASYHKPQETADANHD